MSEHDCGGVLDGDSMPSIMVMLKKIDIYDDNDDDDDDDDDDDSSEGSTKEVLHSGLCVLASCVQLWHLGSI